MPDAAIAQTFAGQVLADLSGLSVFVSLMGFLLGNALWWTGWRLHRFWIVFGLTVGAGLAGLVSGRAIGTQVLLTGLLLAFSAGLMAVELSRVVVFVAGGLATSLLVHTIIPAMREPVIVFLVGGLTGLILFRLWVMVLSSFMGACTLGASGLLLAEKLLHLNAAQFADQRPTLLTGFLIGLTALGVVAQGTIERRWAKRKKVDDDDDNQYDQHRHKGHGGRDRQHRRAA